MGATYDATTQRVSLMFGASRLAGTHLSHTITEVTETDLSTSDRGRDIALRFVHDHGYTLIELE